MAENSNIFLSQAESSKVIYLSGVHLIAGFHLAIALGLFVFQLVLNVGYWNKMPMVNQGKIHVFLAVPQRCQGKDFKESHRE